MLFLVRLLVAVRQSSFRTLRRVVLTFFISSKLLKYVISKGKCVLGPFLVYFGD